MAAVYPPLVAASGWARATARASVVRVRLPTGDRTLTFPYPSRSSRPALCAHPVRAWLQGATIKLGTVVGPALGGMIAHFCGGPSPFEP